MGSRTPSGKSPCAPAACLQSGLVCTSVFPAPPNQKSTPSDETLISKLCETAEKPGDPPPRLSRHLRSPEPHKTGSETVSLPQSTPRTPNSTDRDEACLFFSKRKVLSNQYTSRFPPRRERIQLGRAGAGGGMERDPRRGPVLPAPGGCVRSPPGASGRRAGRLGRHRRGCRQRCVTPAEGRWSGPRYLEDEGGPRPGSHLRRPPGPSPGPNPGERVQSRGARGRSPGRRSQNPGPGAGRTPAPLLALEKHGKQSLFQKWRRAEVRVSPSAKGPGRQGRGARAGGEARGTRAPGLGPLQLAD